MVLCCANDRPANSAMTLSSTTPRWLTAFIDRPSQELAVATTFWARVTGSTVSPPRGERGQFATLLPPDGDPFLRLQGVLSGGGNHLDVHVPDVTSATARATALGATAEMRGGHAILTSPAGLRWCLVPEQTPVGPQGRLRRPTPIRRSNDTASLVDQLCVDIPAGTFETECSFWHELTGWDLGSGSRREFAVLQRPAGIALRLLLQRLDSVPANGRARCHLDLACTDVGSETAVHESWGARVLQRFEHWTTLADPSGYAYCLTCRDPETGVRPAAPNPA